ncbi:uncharacterized protein G2W53_043350 [Senna tora]|uniref:Uncharacterized protein n=1 Tax=Senna tora TaxID=362788 RepID=A0A834SVE7_9FABA|nr:uncharacterized protein G2W53_043350 [Senna tora]
MARVSWEEGEADYDINDDDVLAVKQRS